MRRLLIATAAAMGVLASTTGCTPSNPSPVSAKAANALAPFVASLREAASHKSIPAVQARESDLVSEVDSLVSNHDLSSKRGQSIEDAASMLLTDFRRRNTPTAPPTTPPPTPTVTETTSTPTPSETVTVTVPPTDTASDSTTPGSTPTDTTSKHH